MATKNKDMHILKIAALIITIFLWVILFGMSKTAHIPTGKYLDLSHCGNGIIEPEYGEQCEYNNDSACPGKCKFDCTCSYCGNNVLEFREDCDGAWDMACPDNCQSNCKCPPPESRMLTSKFRQIAFYDAMPQGENFTIASQFSNIALQSMIVHSKTPLTDVDMFIDSNITKPIVVPQPAGFVYQYFNASTRNASQSSYIAAKIYFKVPKDWYVKNGLNRTTTQLNIYHGSWIALKTSLNSEDGAYSYYTATSQVLSLFAITANKYPVPKPIVPVCGNGIVETGETPETCCADASCINANESCVNNLCTFVARCGNGVCEQTETAQNCPVDCGALVLFFPQFLAIFVTLLLVSALTISGHLRQMQIRKARKKHKKEPVMPALSSEEEQVEEYIKKHIKKGTSEREIRKQLIESGWERDFVDVKIQESRSKVE